MAEDKLNNGNIISAQSGQIKEGYDARCINLDSKPINFKDSVKGIYLERDLDDINKETLKLVDWYKGELNRIKNSRIYSIIQDDPNYPTMIIGEIYFPNNDQNIIYFDLNSEGIKKGESFSNKEIQHSLEDLLSINEDLYEEAMNRKTSFLIFSNEGFLDYNGNDWRKYLKQGKENSLGIYNIKGNESDFLISINNDKRWSLDDNEMKEIFDTFSTIQKRMVEDVRNYSKGFDNYKLILKEIKNILSKRNEVPYSIGLFRPGGLYHS